MDVIGPSAGNMRTSGKIGKLMRRQVVRTLAVMVQWRRCGRCVPSGYTQCRHRVLGAHIYRGGHVVTTTPPHHWSTDRVWDGVCTMGGSIGTGADVPISPRGRMATGKADLHPRRAVGTEGRKFPHQPGPS